MPDDPAVSPTPPMPDVPPVSDVSPAPNVTDVPPVPPPPEAPPSSLGERARRDRRWGRAGLAVVAALGVLVAGLVVLKPGAAPQGAAAAATSAAAASPSPASPYDRAVAALNEQAAALIRGDETGWLAAVDPAKAELRTRYRAIFRNLRGLGVTRFEYAPGTGQPVKGDASALAVRVEAAYCFGEGMCPADAATDWAKAPHISQALTLRPVGGRYVISALAASADADRRQPLPWESGELVLARGRRVVVAAAKGQEKQLGPVLAVAEQAAAVADRYAALNGTPQRDYRVFLAGEKQWKSWYGGEPDEWAIGLALPLNRRGIDVVIRMSEMDDARTLRTTVQHELGHVVTLTGAFRLDALEDTWLSEGIAEYIGWQPKRAAQSFREDSVRWQLNRAAPRSMVPARPGPKAPARSGDAFYGLSHWAADCMAHQYGEPELFTFVRLVLTGDNSYDQAAREAYGVPFATVDRACVGWIRKQAAG